MLIKLLLCIFFILSCTSQKYDSVIQYYQANNDTLALKAVDLLLNKQDIKTNISSSEIKRHIDYCLNIRRSNNYMQKLSWNEFCNHILPYKYMRNGSVYNDNINIFNTDLQYLKSLDTSLSIFQVIDSIKYRYKYITYSNIVSNSDCIKEFLSNAKANCLTMTKFNEILFSHLGFAVTTDYIVQWANSGSTHAWNAVLYNDETYPFDPFYEKEGWGHKKLLSNISENYFIGKKRISKVFRRIYYQEQNELNSVEHYSNIPVFFRNLNMIDVSKSYFKTTDITINIPDSVSVDNKFVWIMTFNNKNFTPAYWAKIINNKAVFKGMGRDVLYFFATYHKNNFKIFGTPLCCDENGVLQTFTSSNSEIETIIIDRKYPYLNTNPEPYNLSLRGAKLYGYNDDIDNKTLLAIINDSITSICDTIKMPLKTQPYKNYELFIPFSQISIKDSTILIEDDLRTLADVDLFVKDNKGHVKPGLFTYDQEYNNAFDRNTLTYYSCKTKAPLNIKMSFNEDTTLYGINLTPKNDKNYIYKDFEYELFIWKNNLWTSIERKKAKSNKLLFNNVPKNALLLLKCRTEGKEERVFRYINNKQKWY